MTTTYDTWDQSRLVRQSVYMGDLAARYEPELVARHAVAVDEGEASEFTVCGQRVDSDLTGTLFSDSPFSIRCGRCSGELDGLSPAS